MGTVRAGVLGVLVGAGLVVFVILWSAVLIWIVESVGP